MFDFVVHTNVCYELLRVSLCKGYKSVLYSNVHKKKIFLSCLNAVLHSFRANAIEGSLGTV